MSGYIRHTDGSPAVLLSEAGNPRAFSPDGKWVLTSSPTGERLDAGADWSGRAPARSMSDSSRHPTVSSAARWLPDGERIVFVGGEAGRPRRLFIQNIAGGTA